MNLSVVPKPKPASLALPQIRCRQAMLPQIPVRKFMDVVFHYFEVEEMGMTHEVKLEDVVNIFEAWGALAAHFSKGHSWKLSFFYFASFEDETVELRIEFRRKYLQTQLVAIQKVMDLSKDYWTKDFSYTITCAELASDLKSFLDEANRNIEQWNYICTHSIPTVTEPIPKEVILENVLNALWSLIVDEAAVWIKYEKGFDPDDFSETELVDRWALDDGTVSEDYILHALSESWHTQFGSKGDWHTFCVWLSSESYYSFVYFVVAREKVGISLMPFWIETDGNSFLHVSECDKFIEELIGDINDALLQWNRFVSGEFTLESEAAPLSIRSIGGTSTDETQVWEPKWINISRFIDPSWSLPEGYTQLELPF